MRLVDALAAACSTRGNTTVDLAGKTFTNGDNTAVTINTTGAGNHSDNIFQVGEVFKYTCAE